MQIGPRVRVHSTARYSDSGGNGGNLARAALRVISPGSVDTAADAKLLAGDPARVVGGEEDRRLGNILRLAGAAERRPADGVLIDVRARDARALRAFGDGEARVDRIVADVFRPGPPPWWRCRRRWRAA